MKRLSFILALLLLAGCSGMRAGSNASDTSGTSGASGTRESGSSITRPGDLYRPGG